ncbi:LysR family transcriptional regulator [Lactobacillus mulieris]|uniref:LysR family transcriptional regulator n=1 Tax=Lactobacillus mulieris TaxID=2508708 RepID=A0AAW5WXF5_9LACO|nr:LysR family transcriptional regulator [Lactobacillus mulieris]MCZ3621733.1 LysR family transcriptional regulator [Lactobacillus mulieris]MCZ3622991.1 LysR family transcriptional regulator [Lactobacillus mulieris]MCZ3635740.1 LysR family transcriptional regulator [Lactobacillus mulieris]MCZ3690139.1 LysR family transcriptional regulator [Lactobacillus mulieris]MCZ3696526.1 LysR family transcriptional regulator [Lactobacillus mulieris]
MGLTSLFDYRLKTLVVLVRTKSFTLTAKELFISQPAVSQQIHSLEKDLGFRLFYRSGKSIELTAKARELVAYVQRINSDSSRVLAEIQKDDKKRLSIGASLSLSSFLLPNLLAKTINDEKTPKVDIANTKQLLEKIKLGELDFALIEGNFDKSEFDFFKLSDYPMTLVTNPRTYPVEQWSDILKQPLFIGMEGCGTRDIFEKLLAAHNFALSDFKNVIEVDNPVTVIEMLKQGEGVSFLYRQLICDELKRNELLEITAIPEFNVEHSINLVFAKGSSYKERYQQIATLVKHL